MNLLNNKDIWAWQVVSLFVSFSRKMFPLYSKRRLFAKLFVTFLKHPFRFISKVTPGRVIAFFSVLKTEGTAGVTRRVNIHMLRFEKPKEQLQIETAILYKNKKLKDYKPIAFNPVENPLVSIIIPVYNWFDYTYNCLSSILEKTGKEIDYEVIVADDCSKDLTKEINKIVSDIKVVRTPKNYRFIRNCNYAAKQARGKHILFLNNDTKVQDNWLYPLVDLMENNNSIGAVGSKFVYGNGMLQEAGGILWNDSSTYNYGKNRDPDMSEFNYVKEVDYISAAALMIRKSIWDKLGGFDENFMFAYCEDSDICFSIRKLGFKVMYQPASVVMHFEGISNGNDLLHGQKQYQIVNQKKFFDKWKNVLERENFSNGESIFQARDRSRFKKTVLIIDDHVPFFDRDASARSIFQYLKLFTELEYNVKFIGNDFYKHEPYTSVLEQMGIEVLYGAYYAKKWKKWLKTNGKYIDIVLLNRPSVSADYIDSIREMTPAKIIYYGYNLHFLRDFREYALTNDKSKLRSSERLKKLEFSVMKKSDVVYLPSTFEINLIKEMDSSINCRILPINIFPNNRFRSFKRDRKDLLFVGGFDYAPNIDGILWFVEKIMPIIQNVVPEIKLNVIGFDIPEKIEKLKNDDIMIYGNVGDGVLDEYYSECRICIAPLRFGAGVKGRIIEGMYKQIPIITTSIGAEGLPEIEGCLMIEDKPEEFADKLISMYKDDELLKKLTEKSYNYVMKNFSVDRAKNIINDDFIINKYKSVEPVN